MNVFAWTHNLEILRNLCYGFSFRTICLMLICVSECLKVLPFDYKVYSNS